MNKLFFVIFICIVSFGNANSTENLNISDIKINGDEYTQLKFNGRGLIFKNDEDKDVLVIDKFGGMYLNGELYLYNSKLDSSLVKKVNDMLDFSEQGYFYWMLFLNVLLMALIGFLQLRKKS